jgi:hypothetical protein
VPQVVNLLRIEDAMIETDVQFFQVTTDSGSSYGNNMLQTLGVDGKVGLSGAGTGGAGFNYGVSANASARINALISSGSASTWCKRTSAPRAVRKVGPTPEVRTTSSSPAISAEISRR